MRDLKTYAKKLGYTVQGIFKETASGAKNDRKQRAEVMALAQARKVDAILVTEMSRWGRSTSDLINTLQQLESFGVSLVAQSGLTFDLSSAQGKLIANILASIAEFERDLISERVKSGLAAARARGKVLGRHRGNTFKQDKYEKSVLKLIAEGKSYRFIARSLKIDKNTVMAIVHRNRIAS